MFLPLRIVRGGFKMGFKGGQFTGILGVISLAFTLSCSQTQTAGSLASTLNNSQSSSAIPSATAAPIPVSTPQPSASPTPVPVATPRPTAAPTAAPTPAATSAPTPSSTPKPAPTATPKATPLPGANVFSCNSFSATGSCGVGNGQNFIPNGSVNLTTPNLTFIPVGLTHVDSSLWWSTPVNIQQFTSTFTFVPNGQNFAFVVQNAVGTSGNGTRFNAGAGCEGGFYQAFGAGPLPNNLFALMLDSYSPLTENGSFSYSSTQIYQADQSPCLPNDSGPNYTPTNKLSTSPVNLTAGAPDTTTGDVYSVTVTYDGNNIGMSMYDVDAGGSCPGASCYTHSWPANIPNLVGANTAYVGFTAATGLISLFPLYLDSFSFSNH
jgi:hypothetical protein